MEAVFSVQYAIQPGAVTTAPPNPGSRQYAVGVFAPDIQNTGLMMKVEDHFISHHRGRFIFCAH